MPQNRILKDYRRLFHLLSQGTVYTVIDTETTGLHPQDCRVIQIGALKCKQNHIIDTFEALINPLCPIPPTATAIHHITNDMVANAPEIKVILPVFCDFIKNTVLVGHNVQFDLYCIAHELELCNMKPITNKAIDTLQLSRWAYPTAPKHTLQYLAQAMHIEVKNAHQAFDDARVCREVFLRCIDDTMSIQKK